MERNSVVRKNVEKIFIVEETGEKIVGTIEGIYKVPEGRVEESLREFLKKKKRRNI